MKPVNPVWKLLRRNISIAQTAGYAVASFVGLTIMLCAYQFWRDATAGSTSDADGFIGKDYLVMSKTVSEKGAFFGASTTFSQKEIEDLGNQPWAEKIGFFTPSRFNVSAAVEFGGRGMSSDLFFESIPDEFFDIKPEGWDYDPTQPGGVLPVIIPKDYLALYNFGFAPSRGLPQVSESLIQKVPLRVSVSGNGRQMWLPARIAGFSSRLNTIAVPERFMDWANSNFGEETPAEVSRIIVETSSPGDPALGEYLKSHSIEVAGDKEVSGRATYFVTVVSGVVIAIGLVISVLSFFILMLSIYLLLQKNRDKIHDLMILGYTPGETGRTYCTLVIVLNIAIVALSVATTAIVRSLWQQPLEQLNIEPTSLLPMVGVGLAIMVVVTTVNIVSIRRIVVRNFR